MAPAILRREIGAAEEGLQAGREPDRHGPAAAAGSGLHERHVDALYIRPLFAVHFDGHVVAIQERGDLVVFKRLALHHVAPVTGGIADGKEDGLIFGAGLFECFRPPGVPVHRIVGVLEQVGALLVGEPVGVHETVWTLNDPPRKFSWPSRASTRTSFSRASGGTGPTGLRHGPAGSPMRFRASFIMLHGPAGSPMRFRASFIMLGKVCSIT